MLVPNTGLRNTANAYCDFIGIDRPIQGHYVKVNEQFAEAIAVQYSALAADRSDNPKVRAAYTALLNELIYQWQVLQGFGWIMEPWTEDGQPYANSEEMRRDVQIYNHLYFFTGGEPHPFLDSVVPETGYTGNEMLRAVHDMFGHAAEGYSFGPRGEENAWIHHSMMFSPLAQLALTTETRGQNSWVNFGPHRHLPPSERPYADQKVALLPLWCCDWRSALEQGKEV